MKIFLKYARIASLALVAIILSFILYLTIYPYFSEVRKQCNKAKIGMSREHAEEVMGSLMADKRSWVVNKPSLLSLERNGVDCEIRFDDKGVVVEVTSAVDGF